MPAKEDRVLISTIKCWPLGTVSFEDHRRRRRRRASAHDANARQFLYKREDPRVSFIFQKDLVVLFVHCFFLFRLGLMISAFAKAGTVLMEDTYVERAVKAAEFVRQHLYDATRGRLLRSCYRGDEQSVSQMYHIILVLL